MASTNRARHLGVSGLIVAFGLVAVACGGGGGGSTEGGTGTSLTEVSSSARGAVTPGGNLSVAIAGETDDWNPVLGRWSQSGQLVANTFYDTLTRYDRNGDWAPFLAEKITANDDFTQWTITLRSGKDGKPLATFHDGAPVDSAAVKTNIEAHKKSLLTGPVYQLIGSIDTPDALTVVVNMTSSWSTFPHTLAAQPGAMVSPKTLGTDAASTNPVGSGPFTLQKWTRDKELVVRKNENYWQKGFPLLDSITFQVMPDNLARGTAMESGDIDMFETADADAIVNFTKLARDSGNYQVFLDNESDSDEAFVMFNTTKEPWNDPVARRAAIQAIDTKYIAKVLYEDIFPPAQGPISPESKWYTKTGYPEFDPEAAKAEIEKWEAEHGQELVLVANIPPDPKILEIAQVMQDLAGNVGVEVKLETLELTQLIVEAATGEFQTTGFGQIFILPHPDRSYVFLHSSSIKPNGQLSLNFARYGNPKIDEALDGARTTDDFEEQKAHYADLLRALAEDTPYLWMVHLKSGVIADSNVRDLTTWTFPDGKTEGIPQLGSVVSLHQVWLDQN